MFQLVVQVTPSVVSSSDSVPIVEPYMWYENLTSLTQSRYDGVVIVNGPAL